MRNDIEAAKLKSVLALRQVLPDLEGVPVYIATRTEHPELERVCTGCVGFHSGELDLALSPSLKAEGRWYGRGFACYLDDIWLRKLHGEDNLACACVDVAVHEAAHWLTNALWWDTPEKDWANMPKTFSDGLTPLQVWVGFKEGDSKKDTDKSYLPKWYGHELGFTRAASHIYHRLLKQWPGLLPRNVQFAGPVYQLSSPFTYLEVLRDELHDRETEPIRQILADEPPPEALELWHSDTTDNT